MKEKGIPIFFRFVLLGAITFISAAAEAGGKGVFIRDGPRFSPNEIIIKLKNSAGSSILGQNLGVEDTQVRLPAGIEKVNKEYKVQGIRPVFPHFRQGQERLQGLRDGTRTAETPLEKRLFRRLQRAKLTGTDGENLERIYKVVIDGRDGRSIEEVLQAYRNLPGVEYAELNYVVSACVEPNDSLFGFQWALNNTGQMYPESGRYNHPPGTPDSDIDAPEGWDISAGIEDVVIAVVDTGVYYTHRDLINRMWVNEAELNGQPGIDDDDNGYIDDVYGFDFCNFDGNPFDDDGHGTHCAGTIAAQAGNGVDIAGVCWKGRIMALKFLDESGYGTIEDASAAIIYAVQNGADVISCSWGGTGYSQMLEDAIEYAHSQGVVVAAAAGNNNSSQLFYPAAYENVISVAATNSNDNKATFSNYGSWVDIAAPGVDILSLRPAATYSGVSYNAFTSISSGTSMSCPFVSGACALLLSIDPQQDVNSVSQILYETTDAIDSYICSSGRLNISKAAGALVSTAGRLRLNKQVYSCTDEMKIYLYDADLRGVGVQSIIVGVMMGDTEAVELNELSIGSGIFSGTLPISEEGGGSFNGVLRVDDGETIEADYHDVNVGDGNSALLRYYALADCNQPAVTGLEVISLSFQAERVRVETSEPTKVVLECGQICGGPYEKRVTDGRLSSFHQYDLVQLAEQTQYYFVLTLTNAAGNRVVVNNGGNCFVFTTVARQDFVVPDEFATIQAAVDGAWDSDVITVEDGIYRGEGNRDIDFHGRDLILQSRNGPGSCIIDCNGSALSPHRGFYFHNGESEAAVLDGFTIVNGHVLDDGGAVKCWKSGPMIRNCRFIGNCAEANEAKGGAVSNIGGVMRFTDCEFIDNRAVNPDVNEGELLSGTEGGAIYNDWDSTVEVNNCIFAGNLAASGGGMSNFGLNGGEAVNCIFSGNFARGGDGGGMCNFSSVVGLVNCTFAGNIATNNSGGVVGDSESYTQIKNSIFWGNEDEAGQIESSQVNGVYCDIAYSCVEGWTGELGGAGNIGEDPLFADFNGGDFHLKSQAGRWDPNTQSWVTDDVTSPCIDAGNPASPWQAEPWPNGKRINMGAYGGTEQASKNGNPADFDVDRIVGFADFALFADKWMIKGNFFEDMDNNGIVDSADLCIFVDNWMWER